MITSSVAGIAATTTPKNYLKKLLWQAIPAVMPRSFGSLVIWRTCLDLNSVSLLRSFALGLESDYNAVKAGVTLLTSNGHFCWTHQPSEDDQAPNVWSRRTWFVNSTIFIDCRKGITLNTSNLFSSPFKLYLWVTEISLSCYWLLQIYSPIS